MMPKVFTTVHGVAKWYPHMLYTASLALCTHQGYSLFSVFSVVCRIIGGIDQFCSPMSFGGLKTCSEGPFFPCRGVGDSVGEVCDLDNLGM